MVAQSLEFNIIQGNRPFFHNRQSYFNVERDVDSPKMRVWLEEAEHFSQPNNSSNATGDLVWDHLGQAPYLAYKAENDHLYVVTAPDGLALAVPKLRARAADYTPPRENSPATAFRYLGCAALGLPLAGFGAYPFLLLALWLAYQTLTGRAVDQADRIRAQAVLVIAGIIFTVALVLSTLFFQRIGYSVP